MTSATGDQGDGKQAPKQDVFDISIGPEISVGPKDDEHEKRHLYDDDRAASRVSKPPPRARQRH